MTTAFNPFRIFAFVLLLLCLSGSSFADISSPTEITPEEAISLSIQLNTKTIQASSLEEQIFPMLVSSKINKIDLSSFPRNPVDLVCVFEIRNDLGSCRENRIQQIKEIQNLLKDLQPLMTDQDRLAIVVFSRIGYPDNLMDVSETLPSLTNTTTENWETVIQNIGEKMVKESMSTRKALQVATKILNQNQRDETNRTTGVFISTSSSLGESHPEYCWHDIEDRTIDEIDDAKEHAGVEDKRWIIQAFVGEPKKHGHAFAESFAALRAGIVETRLLIKPEESELVQDVKISNPYFELWCSGWAQENGVFLRRSLSAKTGGQEEFFFDLKIQKIAAQDLLSSPVEVKVASYQLVFLLENGSQVVMKNEDLMVKIVREGEEIIGEEESREAVRNFYHKWGKDWLIPTAWREIVEDYDYEKAMQIVKRYPDSLNGSIVKDDEMLQKIWKDAEEELIWDQEMGVEHDY